MIDFDVFEEDVKETLEKLAKKYGLSDVLITLAFRSKDDPNGVVSEVWNVGNNTQSLYPAALIRLAELVGVELPGAPPKGLPLHGGTKH